MSDAFVCNTDAICHVFYEDNSNPEIELYSVNNFTLLIAIVLSAQTTDKNVNKATKQLFATYNTPHDFARLSNIQLEQHIKTIGLYHTKARHVIYLSKILVEKYHGDAPNTFDELIELPGVGRKTANVFLNAAFGFPTIGVDRHVVRVSNRIGLVNTNKVEEIEKQLYRVVDKKWHQPLHKWLVLHGRYVCTAPKPKCDKCKITQYCKYYADKI